MTDIDERQDSTLSLFFIRTILKEQWNLLGKN